MFKNNLNPLPRSTSQMFKVNATMNYHDSRWRNNECNQLDSLFSFSRPILEAFKFIYILKDLVYLLTY